MKLSVVIPTCHEPLEMIAAAIDSALDQTLAPDCVVVMEDGPRDGLPELVLPYLDRTDVHVILIRLPENVGPLLARRAGIAATASEYVAFNDGDDTSERDRFQRQIEYLDAHPSCGVVSVGMHDDRGYTIRGPATRDALLRSNCLDGGPCMFRREAYDQTGGFDGLASWVPNFNAKSFRLAEDYALWLQIAAEGWSVYRIPDVLYQRHCHDNQLTRNNVAKCQEATATLQRAVRRIWTDRESLPIKPRIDVARAVVTSIDANYYWFLSSQFLPSLRESARFDGEIIVCDYGMTGDQIRDLERDDVTVVSCHRDEGVILPILRLRDFASVAEARPNARLLTVDGGDVFFQAPLDELFCRDGLVCATEFRPKTLRECRAMLGWVPKTHTFGRLIADQLVDGPAINAGMLYGPSAVIAEYLRWAYKACTSGEFSGIAGADQWALTWAARTSKFPISWAGNNRWNYTLCCVRPDVRNGRVYDLSGAPIPIVHKDGKSYPSLRWEPNIAH